MDTPPDPFDRAMAFVLRYEGGFVNHPADPGGATNHGISLRFARSLGRLLDLDRDGDVDADDIMLVTPAEAAKLYRARFWDTVRADDLPPPVAMVAFDTAINCGPDRAARWLQFALRLPQDGAIGPRTLAAARGADWSAVIAEMMAQRFSHHANLPTWKEFGVGWSRRCAALLLFAALEFRSDV
jgi:lysozyme family protein